MRNFKVSQLVWAAALLAICIISQFFKNLSVYITGPIINTCLIICVLTAGLGWALVLCIVTPVTSFIITGSPIMSAIPAIIPCVMVGNAILVVCEYFIAVKGAKAEESVVDNGKLSKTKLAISLGVGTIAKAAFMGVVISLILIPSLLPEAMLPKMNVFQMTFSFTQLITAAIGSVLAFIIWVPISKAVSKN